MPLDDCLSKDSAVTETEVSIYHKTLLSLAIVVIPLCFLVLCGIMSFRRAHWHSYPAYFFLCGTIGGWCLTLALSPSGAGFTGLAFMILTSPVCFIYSLFLSSRQNRDRFGSVAMVSGFVYTALLAVSVISLLSISLEAP